MSTEPAELRLRYVPIGKPFRRHGFEGIIQDPQRFMQLCKILNQPHMINVFKETEPCGTTLKTTLDSEDYYQALAVLKNCGLTPAYTRYVMPQFVTEKFPVLRGDLPSAARLDYCRYVRLAFCEASVGYHYTTAGNTLVALGEKEEFKKTADVGDLAPSRRLAVSAKFMESVRSAGLKGASFLPIEWRPRKGMTYVPDKPIRTHWLNAEKEMPRCLTPRIGFSGDLTGVHFWDNEELIKHAVPDMECGWDDEGRTDFTLRFRRKEVEALGEFDIARTYEWIHLVGNENPRWFPQLIVSQRFRQWAKKQKYKLHYGLCELVD
jgi:hypothetical protein